ncbi:hypothetical protein P9112_013992 [Eukaryota sp. TZLM1-RC]
MVNTSPFDLEGPPLPSNFCQFSEHLADFFMVRALLPNNVRVTVRIQHKETLKALIDKLWIKFHRTNPDCQVDVNQYAVQISGKSDYLIGDFPLFHYPSVFDSLLMKPAILDISFVPIEEFYHWFSFFSSNMNNSSENSELFYKVSNMSISDIIDNTSNKNSNSESNVSKVSNTLSKTIHAPFRVSVKAVANVFETSSKLLSKLNKIKGPDDLNKSNLFVFASSYILVGDRSVTPNDFVVHPISRISDEIVYFPDEYMEIYFNIPNIPPGAKVVINIFALTKPPDVDDLWMHRLSNSTVNKESISIHPLHHSKTSSESQKVNGQQESTGLWFENNEFHIDSTSDKISLHSLVYAVNKSLIPTPARKQSID